VADGGGHIIGDEEKTADHEHEQHRSHQEEQGDHGIPGLKDVIIGKPYMRLAQLLAVTKDILFPGDQVALQLFPDRLEGIALVVPDFDFNNFLVLQKRLQVLLGSHLIDVPQVGDIGGGDQFAIVRHHLFEIRYSPARLVGRDDNNEEREPEKEDPAQGQQQVELDAHPGHD
jgi:hypothetical protein